MAGTNGAFFPQLLEGLTLMLAAASAVVAVNSLLEIRHRRNAEQHFLTALAPRLAEDPYILDQLLENPRLLEDTDSPDPDDLRWWNGEERLYLRRHLFEQIFKTLDHLEQADRKRIMGALYQPSAKGRNNYLRKVLTETAYALRESERGAQA